MQDYRLMCEAVSLAWPYVCLTYPNPAVGAIVVKNGLVIGRGAHRQAGKPHAEVLAIVDALIHTYPLLKPDYEACGDDAFALHERLKRDGRHFFHDATLYVTLEPCAHYGKTPPCAELIASLGFSRVVVGVQDPNPIASGGCDYLQAIGMDVVTGVANRECEVLLEPFLRWTSGQFRFFKIAQTLNGVITGGTISSLASRIHVHHLRHVCDTLVIGGGTVRHDRPILDARHVVGGKAPDVFIYSRQKKWDRTIPLFEVPHRHVGIGDCLDDIHGSLVMLEGGEGMLQATSDEDLWYLFYIAPSCRHDEGYKFERDLEIVYQGKIGDDLYCWGRPITKKDK